MTLPSLLLRPHLYRYVAIISSIRGKHHRQTPCYGLTAGLRISQIEPALISEITGYVKPHTVPLSYCLPLFVVVIFRSQPHLRHIRFVSFTILSLPLIITTSEGIPVCFILAFYRSLRPPSESILGNLSLRLSHRMTTKSLFHWN